MDKSTCRNGRVVVDKSTYIQSQTVCALIEAMGMMSENMQRQALGHSMAYDEAAFMDVINKYGIHHNATVDALRDVTP